MIDFVSIEPQLVALQACLKKRQETVATAESCTGGLLAAALTHLAGSSAVYLGGISAYANAVKVQLLAVEPELLGSCGAVSSEVAEAMANGVRRRLGATWAISLTGIAGPDGGVPGKPVGTVYCGVAGPDGVQSVLFALDGDRETIRWQATQLALKELSQRIRT